MHTQRFFVDANHAGNVDTRILYTGLLINVMNAPIIWFSKEWNNVESSMVDSGSVAMQITRDLTVAIRYKLRFFCVPLDGPSDVICDNQGVVNNTSLP